MRKKIIMVVVLVITLGCIGYFLLVPKSQESKKTPIMELEEYKNIKMQDIEKITIKKYTEGGLEEVMKESKEEIQKLYKTIAAYQIGEETNLSCEDNTTIYILEQKNQDPITIEIECDWLVLGKKRYLLTK